MEFDQTPEQNKFFEAEFYSGGKSYPMIIDENCAALDEISDGYNFLYNLVGFGRIISDDRFRVINKQVVRRGHRCSALYHAIKIMSEMLVLPEKKDVFQQQQEEMVNGMRSVECFIFLIIYIS